jgi:CpXC protein
MSLFNTATATCPVCGTDQSINLVASVNADRRPDLRQAILDGSFQKETCTQCGNAFKTPPLFTYLDLGRHQWILVQGAQHLAHWARLETQASATFDNAYGARATPDAREIGAGLQARVVFGWGALREKLLCAEHGLSDVTLELLKMAVLRNAPNSPLSDSNELRLTAMSGDDLTLSWIESASEQALSSVSVPRAFYDSIEQDADAWQDLIDVFKGKAYVDMNRLLVAP